MSGLKQVSSFESRIDEQLRRIANVLLLNASFTDNIGLLNGKMGIAIFFYHYSHYMGNKIFDDYAGELIDEIYAEINTNTPINFTNGLTGIGWGIEYLVKNGFVQADTDEALAEIDTSVYRNSLYRPFLLENGNDLFGYGLYYIARLREKGNDDENLNTLFKKQHLIYLTDDCERILLKKQFLNFNIQALSIDTINSLTWFLIEMHKIGLFPIKIEKLFHALPEYIELCLQSSDESAGQSQLLRLIESVIPTVADICLQDTYKNHLKKKNGNTPIKDIFEDVLVNNFIKNTWQQIVYDPYIIGDNYLHYSSGKIFSIVENVENWNKRLDNLNKDNMGLTGMAGIGLGLLRAQGHGSQSTEYKAQSQEQRTTKSELKN